MRYVLAFILAALAVTAVVPAAEAQPYHHHYYHR